MEGDVFWGTCTQDCGKISISYWQLMFWKQKSFPKKTQRIVFDSGWGQNPKVQTSKNDGGTNQEWCNVWCR